MKDDEKVPADYVDPMGEYSHDAVSTITIAWEPGAANFEKNLERIITQKWIAIFRSEWKHGLSTVVRGIPNCCLWWKIKIPTTALT